MSAASTPADRIRASFELVAPRAGEIMDRFYTRLFTRAPQVRALFPADMAAQKKHLAAAVGLVVKHASNLEPLRPALTEMGARHAKYGAHPDHYGVVRDEMLGALADIAGPAWNPTLESDWRGALNAVAQIMIAGQAASGSPAARQAA